MASRVVVYVFVFRFGVRKTSSELFERRRFAARASARRPFFFRVVREERGERLERDSFLFSIRARLTRRHKRVWRHTRIACGDTKQLVDARGGERGDDVFALQKERRVRKERSLRRRRRLGVGATNERRERSDEGRRTSFFFSRSLLRSLEKRPDRRQQKETRRRRGGGAFSSRVVEHRDDHLRRRRDAKTLGATRQARGEGRRGRRGVGVRGVCRQNQAQRARLRRERRSFLSFFPGRGGASRLRGGRSDVHPDARVQRGDRRGARFAYRAPQRDVFLRGGSERPRRDAREAPRGERGSAVEGTPARDGEGRRPVVFFLRRFPKTKDSVRVRVEGLGERRVRAFVVTRRDEP